KESGRWLENLTTDSGVLLDAILKVGNVRLVIIDPIVDFAGGKKENSNSEVREYLTGLKKIAECNHLAIIGLSHLNKDSQKIAAHRTLGSVAWTAYPRTAWVVERDPEDEERRCLLKIKCNGARTPLNAAFRFRNVPVLIDGKPEGYPVCDFEAQPISMTADDILNVDLRRKKQTKIDEAKEWLELFLSKGPKLSIDILSAALKKGITQATLYRAKDKLQIKIHDNRVEGKIVDSQWSLSG
ncbi:AAA family ATPase, partial [Candidatus Pacearchaeota archaeon]|nr:AAA family ATPase [Candidatus Pacearchaeota archaeon]